MGYSINAADRLHADARGHRKPSDSGNLTIDF